MIQNNQTDLVAIVAGATGLVGRELVRLLSASPRYKKILVLIREGTNPPVLPKVEFQALNQANSPMQGDEFYCCLGTTIKKAGSKAAFQAVDRDLVVHLAKRAKAGGVRRAAIITAIGSSTKSPFFYSRVKGHAEWDLRSMQFEQLDIYQPSLLLGDRDEFRLGEKIGEFAAKLLKPFFVGSLRVYAPIHAADLARHMIEQSNSPNLAILRFLGSKQVEATLKNTKTQS